MFMEISVEPTLFEYGIRTENSDVRAHVCVLARKVYAFRTKDGVTLLDTGNYTLKPAYQTGVVGRTTLGAPIPIKHFPDLRVIKLPGWEIWSAFTETARTSEKGRLAVQVVVDLLSRGGFPLWVIASDDDRKSIQIKGTDIVVFARQKIQVKCDYKGGEGHKDCTGNLFIQTAERNPLKAI